MHLGSGVRGRRGPSPQKVNRCGPIKNIEKQISNIVSTNHNTSQRRHHLDVPRRWGKKFGF